MHASIGDWLVVKVRGGGHQRRAAILGVGRDGSPPYEVRWTDTGHKGVVFPGPTDAIISAADVAVADRLANDRITQVQSAIARNQHS